MARIMRDYILLYVNGQRLEVRAGDAFKTLSNFLRYGQGQTGTKVVCEEGDCGACTVLLGSIAGGDITYKPVHSCTLLMCQLDLTHVVTIEGLTPPSTLNPVQEAMVACHGAQCGFCTPGFVVAMCSVFDRCQSVGEKEIKDGLTGNLCRCTGYEPIIKAGLAVDAKGVTKLAALYPSKAMLQDFQKCSDEAVSIADQGRHLSVPRDLTEAAKFKEAHPGLTVVSGGTDVCVVLNKRGVEPKDLLCLNRISGIDCIVCEKNKLIVGALATLAQLEETVEQRIPELHGIMWLFGSPQIRYSGTLAGNIVNASPIADTIPFLLVSNAELELVGTSGTRKVNINQFYKGYKQLDLKPDELVARIHIPLPTAGDIMKLFKVSRRRNLDISTFTAAFYLELDGKDTIKSARIAYGGVGPVVLRLPQTEKFLAGKSISDEKAFKEAGALAKKEITPISDVRGSADFRNQLAANIMQKLYFELQAQKEPATCR